MAQKKEVKISVNEGKQFRGLVQRLKNLAISMKIQYPNLVKKVLSDFADQNEKKE